MKKINTAFWAKKKEKNGKWFWLPLTQHLEDTMNIAGLLWEHWLGDGQKDLIVNSLSQKSYELGKKLVLFLAAVHDIGKATPVFQIMRGYSNSPDLDKYLLERLERAGFVDISTLSLISAKCTQHAVAGEYLLYCYGVRDDIGCIIGGHHGKPVDEKKVYLDQSAYPNNYFQTEKKNSTYEKWVQEQKKILEWALETSGINVVENLPEIKQPAQVILSGLLIMADWIASNEEYFPLLHIDETEVPDQIGRIQSGFSRWKKSDLWQAEEIYNLKEIYETRFDFAPRNVQFVLSKTIQSTETPGIFILEAPMGIGKTEAALVGAEQLVYKTKRNGLFFGLPTQATSNGIFPRICSWLERVEEGSGEQVSLRLVHGKANLNDDFLSLANNINSDDPENGSVIVNEWFSGRKTASLDDFVVGTVDQFLMVSLKQKHLVLRHLGFSKKVVVIDEVHAYDAYMSQYLLMAIRWMGAYGVPVIILSATLPAERRFCLLKAYMQGIGAWDRREEKRLKRQLLTDAYPLITYNDGSRVCQIKEFEKGTNKKVTLIKLPETELESVVGEMIEEGGVVGIIVNTVKRAQELGRSFSKVFGESLVEILHAGFTATERMRKEKNLLDQIGKGTQRPPRKIIIGTQVIEQSLDIDFDVMISDLAPMDLLIQRIGRLHRHTIERPPMHKNPRFYVLGTSDELEFETGSSAVYGDFLLARTQYFLPESIRLPADISPLVQKVYGKEEVHFGKGLDLKYDLFIKKQEDYISAKEGKAKNYRIMEPGRQENGYCRDKVNLIAWLKNTNPDESEERAYAQVRDTNETVEVIALKKVGRGYGLFGESEDISEKIKDFKMAKKVAGNTLRLPNILCMPNNIDDTIKELEKYNWKNLRTWQELSWLKGSLGIIFDENNEFVINHFKIRYEDKYGITAERVK